MMLRLLLALLLLCAPASAASLLPPGKQQFLLANGAPNAGGSVYFYIPSTTTPKDTYQNAGGTILNTNPVGLDSGGFATIYGSGSYRMILKDASGNTIYDQLTADTSSTQNSWAGTSTGSANAIVLTATGFSAQDGQTVSWKNGFTNTSGVTITISGSSYALVKDTVSGPIALTGAELTIGNVSSALYDASIGQFHLIDGNLVAPFRPLTAAPTTDLGSALSQNVTISGATTITSFGSSASTALPLYRLVFTTGLTITYNATSLITPTAQNLVIFAGGEALAQYRGSGNWTILEYSNPIKVPTRQTLTAASGTYTTPSGATRLFVRMVGGGGGGGGCSVTSTAGGNGGTTSFGAFTAIGGTGGTNSTNAFGAPGGLGGTGGAGAALLRRQGASGGAGAANSGGGVTALSGSGGLSFFGKAGVINPSGYDSSYYNAAANSGSGGAGDASGSTGSGGGGGGGMGEYVEVAITAPAATYSYIIGAAGTAGSSNCISATVAGAGGSGIILVDEYYGLN